MGRGDGGAAATPRGGGHTGVDSHAPTSAPGRRGAQHSLLASLWRRVAVPSTLKLAVLAGCYVIAFCVRLFSVLRYESVIHEFDPYFNFRTTKFLSAAGPYALLNWFDDRAWYPVGRVVGGTIYPGLMATASAVYWLLNSVVHLATNIRNVCVFLAPWMAGNTALVAYVLAKEVVTGPRLTDEECAAARRNRRRAESAGLLAALFTAVVPGYIARSTAGSFDNEGVAIFALLATYTLWVRAVHTGSIAWAGATAVAYLYMASAWGGYVFIINLLPLHVLVLMAAGMYSHRLYVAFSTFYVIGTLLSMQVPFVGFQAVYSAEHMAAFAVFGLLQVGGALMWVRGIMSPLGFSRLKRVIIVGALGAGVALFAVATATGYLAPVTGRFYALLDPTYAKAHIPIIASVSEHQPTAWASFFFDLHVLVFLVPVGMYYAITSRTNEGKVFLVLYGVTAVYFAGVMVRLILLLAPIACLLSALAVSELLSKYMGLVKTFQWAQLGTALGGEAGTASAGASGGGSDVRNTTGAATVAGAAGGGRRKHGKSRGDQPPPLFRQLAVVAVAVLALLLCFYVVHSSWVASEMYSSPSILLSAKQQDGSRVVFDDFREAYWWLRMNTPEDSKILSWWDYGYQLTAMANRTVIVDNGTWNNTHIATVGRVMCSTEAEAYPILRSLDVDYVVVVFGGLTGYSSDDLNKFIWMVRIASSVFPSISEADYFTASGEFRVDKRGAPALLNSLLYKLSYHRFGEVSTEYERPAGYDRVRRQEVGNKELELEHLEEVMSTSHMLVRVYRVKQPDNRVRLSA